MGDLTAFVNARLDEDEAAAHAALHGGSGRWERYREADLYDLDHRLVTTSGEFAHIIRHDPARVLREVEAMRAILAAHAPYRYDGRDGEGVTRICAVCVSDKDGYAEEWAMDLWPCLPVRAIATAWSDHPDYRPEWKP
jgi:hypothetical protein